MTGCGGSYKIPTTGYEKVKTAFNGVEKSFKRMQASQKKASYLEPRYKNIDAGLNSLSNFFTSDDIRSHSLEDLEYNQPPMIQFQYLKGVFEKVGSGYEFGTKYFDNITGDMYLDIYTGFKDETKKQENKYSFDFKLAIDIDIDDNDLINADVSFDIELRQDNDIYNSKWYVNLLLDYDMEKSSPNYTLSLYTENDETDLPYYEHFTYEYDYVNVQNNNISEWRKLCMHSSERLVKDADHQSFGDYLDKDLIDYKVDYPKWFKDGNLYRKTTMSESEERFLGNIMFDDFGLNANDINADPFFAKEGSRNAVIKEMYDKFSQIRGDGIVYDLMCKDEDDNGNEMSAVNRIIPMDENGTQKLHNPSVPDQQIGNMFLDGFQSDNGQHTVVTLWYTSENEQPVSKINPNEISTLLFAFAVHDDSDFNKLYGPIGVSFIDTIKDAYASLIESGTVNKNFRQARLYFAEQNSQIGGYLDFTYTGDFFETSYIPPTFPNEMTSLGIPTYTSKDNKLSFDYKNNGGHHLLEITNTDENDYYDYLGTLKSAGFDIDSDASSNNANELHYRKEHDKNTYVKLSILFVNNAKVTLDAYLAPKQGGSSQGGNSSQQQGGGSSSQQQGLNIYSLALVGDFNNWELTGIKFQNNDPDYFVLSNFSIQANQEFKLVANQDWTVHNPNTSYGGFGFDDIKRLENQDCFSRKEGPDGNIHANMTCTFSIEAVVVGDTLIISLFDIQY